MELDNGKTTARLNGELGAAMLAVAYQLARVAHAAASDPRLVLALQSAAGIAAVPVGAWLVRACVAAAARLEGL